MIANKKKFSVGIGMMVTFVVVMAMIFSPIFNGQNGLDYLDSLYNSISKGSAYYIPSVKEDTQGFKGAHVDVVLEMQNSDRAAETALLFEAAGAMVQISGATLKVSGDLGAVFANCLEDTDLMYHNKGEEVAAKYNGINARQSLYNWYNAMKSMDKALKAQKKFKEAKAVSLIIKKGVECSYNYYTIEPRKITDSPGIIIFSLIFYVVYTLWYGFGILYLFEGWGLNLEH